MFQGDLGNVCGYIEHLKDLEPSDLDNASNPSVPCIVVGLCQLVFCKKYRPEHFQMILIVT